MRRDFALWSIILGNGAVFNIPRIPMHSERIMGMKLFRHMCPPSSTGAENAIFRTRHSDSRRLKNVHAIFHIRFYITRNDSRLVPSEQTSRYTIIPSAMFLLNIASLYHVAERTATCLLIHYLIETIEARSFYLIMLPMLR